MALQAPTPSAMARSSWPLWSCRRPQQRRERRIPAGPVAGAPACAAAAAPSCWRWQASAALFWRHVAFLLRKSGIFGGTNVGNMCQTLWAWLYWAMQLQRLPQQHNTLGGIAHIVQLPRMVCFGTPLDQGSTAGGTRALQLSCPAASATCEVCCFRLPVGSALTRGTKSLGTRFTGRIGSPASWHTPYQECTQASLKGV